VARCRCCLPAGATRTGPAMTQRWMRRSEACRSSGRSFPQRRPQPRSWLRLLCVQSPLSMVLGWRRRLSIPRNGDTPRLWATLIVVRRAPRVGLPGCSGYPEQSGLDPTLGGPRSDTHSGRGFPRNFPSAPGEPVIVFGALRIHIIGIPPKKSEPKEDRSP